MQSSGTTLWAGVPLNIRRTSCFAAFIAETYYLGLTCISRRAIAFKGIQWRQPTRSSVQARGGVTRGRHPDLAQGCTESEGAVAGEGWRSASDSRPDPAGSAVLAPRARLAVARVQMLAELAGVAWCATVDKQIRPWLDEISRLSHRHAIWQGFVVVEECSRIVYFVQRSASDNCQPTIQ